VDARVGTHTLARMAKVRERQRERKLEEDEA
jgi:hypothetical protein